MTKVTARSLLTTWANQQDGWVRSIVSEVLVTRSRMGHDSLARALGVLLDEKGLTQTPLAAGIPEVADTAAVGDTLAELKLVSLADVSHVNALSSGQKIEFHPALTILFGENGSGKSGYCRILKRLANVRSVEEIIDDVDCAAPSAPAATIQYSLGEQPHEIKWDGEAGVAPLGRVAVFDSRAVGLHVDDDLNYQYTPGDLVLYRLCHGALEDVNTLLDQHIESRAVDLPLSSSTFNRGSEVFGLFESLGAGTDLERLQAIGTFDEASGERLRQLEVVSAALQPDNLENRAKAAAADIELFADVVRALDLMIGFDRDAYGAAIDGKRAAEEVVQRTTTTALGHTAILGREHPTWTRFTDCGEEFMAATHPCDFPQGGGRCPYCQQGLSAAAIELIQSYRELAQSAGQQQLDACERALEVQKARVSSVDVEALQQRLATRMASVPESGALADRIAPILTAGVTLSQRVVSEALLGGWEMPPGLHDLRGHISSTVTEAREKLMAVQKEAKEREAELATRTVQLKNLQDRQKLTQHLPAVLRYVNECRWSAKAEAISKQLPNVLRSLTAVAKQASAVVLNGDFEARFFAEWERLRAPKLKLDFLGRKGEAARRKVVGRKHRVSDVLSEGEQKVIALADFLAEASLQEASAPVVLDDAVNSLDYRRIHEVVARLIAIAMKQQTVIFTHNIWFVSLLLDQAKKNCRFYQIHDDGRQKGLVAVDTAPRTDGLGTLKKTIDEKIRSADRAEDVARQALVESAYGSLRAWCEVAVEREFLHEVVTRYQPMVRLTALDRFKPQALKTAIDCIMPIYERACRTIEAHSQPLETLNVRASLKELKADWASALEALNAYKNAAP